MRILVTGGAGFIGSHLGRFLLSAEARSIGVDVERLVTLDKLSYAGNRANLSDVEDDSRHHFVIGDINDAKLVGELLRAHKINAVMHLAAESHVDRSIQSSEIFLMSNVAGTQCLLEQVRQYWLSEKSELESPRFIHVSTDEVFGSLNPNDALFDESSKYAPNSPYSASKAASDHWVRAYGQTYGLPVITTWSSNNYGSHQHPEKLIPLMVKKLMQGERLPLYGDGLQIRDWLHVDDHCRALCTVLNQGEVGGGYCIGGSCEMRNLDVVQAVIDQASVLGLRLGNIPEDGWIEHVQDRIGHDQRYAMDSTKIQRELGWSPQVDFVDGLRKTVRWYLDQPGWIAGI